MTHNTKAYVAVANFGEEWQQKELAQTIGDLTGFFTYVHNGVVVTECRVSELGKLMLDLASYDKVNWIEYTVRLDL